MKSCYIASSYTHPDASVREARYQQAVDACVRLSKEYIVYSPIAMWHPIASKHKLPTTWEFWWEQNKGIIDAVDCIVVLRNDGWEKSKGVKAEIDYCLQIGKDVVFVDV